MRARAYAYTFDSSNGTAWKEVTTSPYSNMGLLLDNTGNSTEARVRFYGEATNTTTTVYTENMSQSLQNVTLKRYNFNETWTSSNGNSNRFTHKENMSWNLFGSPYLCAMNYKDMEYGRVLYGLDGSAYRTVNTETEGQPEGYIPAGDAVFTQTATLKDAESFNVAQPTTNNLKNGTPYQGSEALTISLTRAATGEADNASAADLLQLKAVPTTEARNDFDLSADGVKWMAAGEPQLYASVRATVTPCSLPSTSKAACPSVYPYPQAVSTPLPSPTDATLTVMMPWCWKMLSPVRLPTYWKVATTSTPPLPVTLVIVSPSASNVRQMM